MHFPSLVNSQNWLFGNKQAKKTSTTSKTGEAYGPSVTIMQSNLKMIKLENKNTQPSVYFLILLTFTSRIKSKVKNAGCLN